MIAHFLTSTMYLSCGAFFLRKKEESSTLRVYLLIEAIMFFELIKVPVSPHGFGGQPTSPALQRNGHRKQIGKNGLVSVCPNWWFLESEKSFQTNQLSLWKHHQTWKWLAKKNCCFPCNTFLGIFWAKIRSNAPKHRLQRIPFLLEFSEVGQFSKIGPGRGVKKVPHDFFSHQKRCQTTRP